MKEQTVFLDEKFCKIGSARTQPLEAQSPWTEELENFMKQPLRRKRRNPLNQQHSRYKSQLKPHTPKFIPKDEIKREYMLPASSVTIQYDTDHKIQQRSREKPSRLKLPSIYQRRGNLLLQRSLQIEHQDGWCLLGQNKRGSLRKSTPKWRDEEPPQFQIYKRRLMAARKYVLKSVSKPESALRYHRLL